MLPIPVIAALAILAMEAAEVMSFRRNALFP